VTGAGDRRAAARPAPRSRSRDRHPGSGEDLGAGDQHPAAPVDIEVPAPAIDRARSIDTN
jgi:hypothetical protein